MIPAITALCETKIKLDPLAFLPTYSEDPVLKPSRTRTAMAVARLAIPNPSAITVPVQFHCHDIAGCLMHVAI